jgi:hypothetical protein
VDFGEILTEVWAMIQELMSWVMDQLIAFGQWVIGIFQQLLGFINTLFQGLKWFGEHLWRGIKALRKVNFKTIWRTLKRAWNYYQKALEWWRKHVQEPIDRMRRQIWQIYRAFFKPVLMLLDSFRPIIRIIGIFNRKLAAKLDHRLVALEGKIMWPITHALHRLNEISSYFTAIITAAGRLARPLLLESIRRDALLVWEVLTNPRAVIYETIPNPEPQPTMSQTAEEVDVYLKTGAGPLAEILDKMDQVFREAQADLG